MLVRLLLLFLQVFLLIQFGDSSRIVLNDNGYDGLTVMIKDNVPESGLNKIDNIKKRFTDASTFLFNSTNRRAYFRNITIVIPQSWTGTPVSQTVSSVSIFAEHVRVERVNQTFRGPYVRGNLECGKPAWYMRVDPLWLFLDDVEDKPHDKALVHEWGHLRWGLFDEYASIDRLNASNPGQKINFDSIDQEGNPKPVACTKGIQGSAKRNCDSQSVCSVEDALDDPDCKFCPVVDQPAITASIMSHHYLSGVNAFCDVDGGSNSHDNSAQNAQNHFCNGMSAWEVMRLHEDFKDGNNPSIPADQEVDTTPTFRVVRETGKVRVLVFDVSGSMAGDRILQQRDAAHFTIDTVIQPGSCLGIVEFSSDARILANMTMVLNITTKQQLKDSVPSIANGRTDIYKGLLKGIEVIENAAQPCSSHTEGAEIILLSDGKSNDPYLENISSNLDGTGIILHTVAITNSADEDMRELARRTEGRSFTYLQTQTVSFADALGEALTTNDISSFAPEKILSETFVISMNQPASSTLYLEEGLGDQTIFTVEFDPSASTTFAVVGPSGDVAQRATTSGNLVVEIPGIAEPGLYHFNITTHSNTNVQAFISVNSKPISADVEIVRVRSYLSNDTIDSTNGNEIVKLYVLVEKGTSPVLNANVTAVLNAGPDFEPRRLDLEDLGKGADNQANDGIYSVYLVKSYFTSDSLYNIKVTITNTDNSVVYTEGALTGGAEAALLPSALSQITYTSVPVPDFQRQSVPPVISITNFVADPPDTTPPARITDLAVHNKWENRVVGDIYNSTITFNIAWTAVGDDMTVGTASGYDMRLDKNITIVRRMFESASTAPVNLTTPLPSGQTETVNLTISQATCNTTCYLAIRARDATGLLSDVSNIIPIEVYFPVETAPTSMSVSERRSVIMIIISSVTAAILLACMLYT